MLVNICFQTKGQHCGVWRFNYLLRWAAFEVNVDAWFAADHLQLISKTWMALLWGGR